MILTVETEVLGEKAVRTSSLSITNTIWTGLGSNPVLCRDPNVMELLSYCPNITKLKTLLKVNNFM